MSINLQRTKVSSIIPSSDKVINRAKDIITSIKDYAGSAVGSVINTAKSMYNRNISRAAGVTESLLKSRL
jgi:hypothetical protein